MDVIKANRRKIENIFAMCILTVFMGQIYISPYTYGFRLSLAVVVLSLFLLYFKDYNELLICTLVGFLMFAFRGMITYLSSGNLTLSDVAMIYIPVIAFYIPFGLLFRLLEVRAMSNRPLNFMLSLWVCDSFSNLIEACFRKVWTSGPFDKIVMAIIIMGGLRTIVTYMVYWLSNYYVSRFKIDQKEKYYKELVLFTSRLKTELFFLKKSRSEIESTVSFLHEYYQKVNDPDLKGPLLKIAKDIHEVKKDYLRVIAGMESAFTMKSPINYMSNRDILFIIKDNMVKIAQKQHKKIIVTVDYNTLFTLKEYYPIISILNNLTINSIDAIHNYGHVYIDCLYTDDLIRFRVKDNGVGIREDKLDAIFGAGYSTKYDKVTGEMSSGIGLTHVEQIVKKHFEGHISVRSELGNFTEFIVEIPYVKVGGGLSNDTFNLRCR
ncbi:ATP-binding protein [Anaeromicrobium sediminis]|uniref:ATP-binding protein n=1 Tax=Anaeromicrobium sediminis TaxID=1478221 RepID=UPI001595F60E|nr:ATP-binding protein [Anaeromicrobium sediminis]